jgi:hypothetical protein
LGGSHPARDARDGRLGADHRRLRRPGVRSAPIRAGPGAGLRDEVPGAGRRCRPAGACPGSRHTGCCPGADRPAGGRDEGHLDGVRPSAPGALVPRRGPTSRSAPDGTPGARTGRARDGGRHGSCSNVPDGAAPRARRASGPAPGPSRSEVPEARAWGADPHGPRPTAGPRNGRRRAGPDPTPASSRRQSPRPCGGTTTGSAHARTARPAAPTRSWTP